MKCLFQWTTIFFFLLPAFAETEAQKTPQKEAKNQVEKVENKALVPDFDPGKTCVGFKVEKTMFIFNRIWVFGKNCDLEVSLQKEGGGYSVHLIAPVTGFDSGIKDRDEELQELMGAPEQKNVTFVSQPQPLSDLKKILRQKTGELRGSLQVAGKTKEIVVPLLAEKRFKKWDVFGISQVSLADFEIPVPKVGWGLVAKAQEQVELHYSISLKKVKGIEAIQD